MDDLPYKVEYAKSSRAKCRGCKMQLMQGELRLAAMVQSFFHDGKDAHWFHLKCFFQKHRPQSINDIDHYEQIRIEDQKEIREKLSSVQGILLPDTSKGKKKGKKRAAEDDDGVPSAVLKDFGVEYAKTSRATCAGCGNLIMQHEIRVKKVDYTTEVGIKFGGQPIWHHPECFVKIRGDYNYYLSGADLPGFSALSAADKKKLKESIPAIKITAEQAKKLKAEPRDKDELKAENELEDLIAKQTKQMFKVRDTIDPMMSKGDLQNILFANDSGMVDGRDLLLERCADFLTFGAIEKCKKCKKGDMIFAKYGYRCNGNLDEWTACENFEEKPARVKCKIPSEIKNRYKKEKKENFFTKYKSKIEDRAVRPQIKFESKKSKDEEEGKRVFKVQREREPLYGMHCVILGHTETPKDELKKKIIHLGGRLVTKLQEQIAFVISNKDEIEKMNSRMQEVKSYDIQVVPESFLAAVEKGKREDAIEKIKSMSICDWGSDPLTRIPQEEVKTERESIYNRSQKKTAFMKLKNGTAIDPESGLEDVAHVYRDKLTNLLYTVALGFTDIQKNKNSYYKLQILESDKGHKYWLFRSWGRIGTSVGDSKVESFPCVEDAIEEFQRLFEDKSGNIFGTPFRKKPQKYTLVDVDYDDNEEKNKKMDELAQIPSKLHKSVQELVKMIFDIDTMKKAMMEFELDLEKMPLGRLSRKQLKEAYETLNELDRLIMNGENDDARFVGLSNKFFSLVPHSFGMKKAPVINTVEMIKQKREMVDSLLEIEIAYSMLKDDDNNNEVNPIDAHYDKLKTDLKPLDKSKDEFKLIENYIQNTHAETHNQYSLEVVDVFKVKRENEARRYKPFKKLHNRQLLWHGSRLTNYVGILSHGLKIAPPEAPVTGYMFGKGIYFADMVSKSANYCCTSPQNPIGLMLLSEVALGDMHELTKAKYIEKLPAGKHSTKGIGKTQPNAQEFKTREDGVIVPCGKPVTNDKLRSELLYNEYIVYDVAQVNVQYLLKLKFNYKRR